MIHYFKLVRPVNLFMIALMMLILGAYFDNGYTQELTNIQGVYFWMLILATVLVAGAGNVINDYFDVATDVINKPEKVVVDRYVSRIKTMKFYIVLNGIALMLSVILCYQVGSWWFLLIHALSINFLWFYSLKWKSKLLIGNIIVALLTATVPVYVGLFFQLKFGDLTPELTMPFQFTTYANFPMYLSLAFAGFAFYLNFIREVVKDMEDIEGDSFIKARTFPIVYGVKTAKNTVVIALILFALTLFPIIQMVSMEQLEFNGIIPFIACVLIAITLVFLLLRSVSRGNLKKISLGLKLMMLIGALMPLFWMIST